MVEEAAIEEIMADVVKMFVRGLNTYGSDWLEREVLNSAEVVKENGVYVVRFNHPLAKALEYGEERIDVNALITYYISKGYTRDKARKKAWWLKKHLEGKMGRAIITGAIRRVLG